MVDSDQLASQKPSDLDLHFFQNRIISVPSMVRVEKQHGLSMTKSCVINFYLV